MNKLRFAAFVAALSMGVALAATAPGTAITNTASATYTDPDGGTQTTTSNEVSTTVTPLGSFDIQTNQSAQTLPLLDGSQDATITDANLNKSGVQGQVVNFPYRITNSGNYNDVYNLAVNDGTRTFVSNITGLATSNYQFFPSDSAGLVAGGATAITSIAVNAGVTQYFVMRVNVPAGATSGQVAYADPVGTATTNLVTTLNGAAAGTGPFTVSPPTEANNNYQYNKLTVNAQAQLTVAKTFSKFYSAYTSSATNTPVIGAYIPKVGDFVEYTITVNNTSTLSGASGVSITDVVPAGTQFVDGAFSSGTGVVTSPTVNAGATVTATPTGGTIAASGTVTLTYVFKILNLADTTADSINDPVVNAATAAYNDVTTGTPRPPVTGTAGSINVVAVGVGPSGDPTGIASGTVAATQPAPNAATLTVIKTGTGVLDNGTAGPGNDLSTIPRAVVNANGSTTDIFFPNTLKNTGTLTDTFTLSSSVTTGIGTVSFYSDAAGTTLLTLADRTLAPGATLTYYTRVTLPAATLSVDGTAGAPALSVTVTATSGNNASVTDTTKNVLEDTNRKATLVGNNTSTPLDNNGAPDAVLLIRNANPVVGGTEVSYPVDLVNTGLDSDTITPSGSITIPLVGGGNATPTVTYYLLNADGTRGAQVTSVPVGAGQEVSVVAVFTVPASAAPTGSGSGLALNQTFTSTQNGAVTFNPNDTLIANLTSGDLLTIGQTNAFTFTADSSSRITASGSTIYSHTLNNLSTNTSITAANFAVALDTDDVATSVPLGSGLSDSPGGPSLDSGTQANFEISYSLTLNGTYTTALPASGTIAPEGSVTLYVKVVNKVSNNVGAVNDLVISATPTFSGGTNPAVQYVEDVTVVKASGLPTDPPVPADFALKPVKSVDKSTAQPGDILTYTIVGTNNRLTAAALTGTVLNDVIPTNTTFESVQVNCSNTASGGLASNTSSSTGFSDATTAITKASAGWTGTISQIWAACGTGTTPAASFPSAGVITVILKVKVN